jgi:MtN3 and saliva related transmembrane protein
LSSESILGYIAAVLTTVSFLPQVTHIYKTRDTSAISLSMYLMFSIGVFLWFIYGVLIHAWPMVIANGITLLLALTILFLKIKNTSSK